jgi:hypothetical protein
VKSDKKAAPESLPGGYGFIILLEKQLQNSEARCKSSAA